MNENNNLYSDKLIILFFALWRTCCKIAHEMKIHKGIKNYVPSKEKYKMYIGQSLSTNFNINIEDYTDNDNVKIFYYKFTNIIKKFGFKNIIKILDNNFGIISNEILLEIKN